MAIKLEEVDLIAERWSADSWDQHERAFARQWMRQAQQDVRDLVEYIRELQGEARDVADGAESVASKLESLGP